MFRQEQWTDYNPVPSAAGGDTRMRSTAPDSSRSVVGSAFQPQTTIGVRMTDPADDRVEYLADESGGFYSMPLWSLPADLASTGQAAAYGGDTFGGIEYATDPENHAPDFRQTEGGQIRIVQSSVGHWYSTLRRWAGFPLPGPDDVTYANATNDIIGDTVNDAAPLLIGVGVRLVAENPIDVPSRYSGHPISTQEVRPWDTLMGAWPWSGDKDSLGQPVVSTPLFFAEPLEDGLPSASGAAGSMVPNTPSNQPDPLTWRVAPSPWDTGQSDGRGTYIDSGTFHDGY